MSRTAGAGTCRYLDVFKSKIKSIWNHPLLQKKRKEPTLLRQGNTMHMTTNWHLLTAPRHGCLGASAGPLGSLARLHVINMSPRELSANPKNELHFCVTSSFCTRFVHVWGIPLVHPLFLWDGSTRLLELLCPSICR